jgi:hypothetical protein
MERSWSQVLIMEKSISSPFTILLLFFTIEIWNKYYTTTSKNYIILWSELIKPHIKVRPMSDGLPGSKEIAGI